MNRMKNKNAIVKNTVIILNKKGKYKIIILKISTQNYRS